MKTVAIALTMVALLRVTPAVYSLPVTNVDAIRQAAPLDLTQPSASLYDTPDTGLARRGSSFSFIKSIKQQTKEQVERCKQLRTRWRNSKPDDTEYGDLNRGISNAERYLLLVVRKEKNPRENLRKAKKELDDVEWLLNRYDMSNQYR